MHSASRWPFVLLILGGCLSVSLGPEIETIPVPTASEPGCPASGPCSVLLLRPSTIGPAEVTEIEVRLRFLDDDRDIEVAQLGITAPSGASERFDCLPTADATCLLAVEGELDQVREGTMSLFLPYGSDEVGRHTVAVVVLDARGHRSNELTGELVVDSPVRED